MSCKRYCPKYQGVFTVSVLKQGCMMKVASKRLSLILPLICLFFLMENRAFSMAQISLQNNTSFWLNLYIDGNFGCGPVMPNGFCISSVKPGARVLEARKRGSSEPIVPPETVDIGDGTSPTWTVTIEDPDQALVKALNGSKFTNQRTEPPKAKDPLAGSERELFISGKTMYWKVRFTWVKPKVQLPRPVGEWREISRIQLTGRENHLEMNIGGDRYQYVFTISEDGNTITEVEKCDKFGYTGTYVYTRQ